jgi:hypothetical protein
MPKPGLASPPEKTDPTLPFVKGDTEGFIRGTPQGNSPSVSAGSFQFGPNPQIASGQSKNTECFRILTSNNSFVKFQNKKGLRSEPETLYRVYSS